MIRKSDAELDALDQRIAALLRDNARQRNVDIARALSISEKTVRNRIERLVSEHGLRFHASLPDGHSTRMIYLLRVSPGLRFELANDMSQFEEVSTVQLTNGAADLVILAGFDDASAALEFSVQKLESDPRVVSIEECAIVREVSDGAVSEASADVPVTANHHLVKSFVQMPNFPTSELAQWWLARLLQKAFSADHIMVTTAVPDHLFEGGPRLDPHVVTINLPSEYVDAITRRVYDDRGETLSLVLRAAQSRQHVFVEDARSSIFLHLGTDLIPLVGYVSVLAFPIMLGDDILGAAVLYYDKKISISDELVGNIQRVLDYFVVVNRSNVISPEASA